MLKRSSWRIACVWIVAGLATACGSSSGTTLSPTNVSTITGISLVANPPGVGATVSAVATLSLSNGNSVAISSGFTSDTPSVATVTAAGAMTGVSIGDVTIAVDYQGFKASKKVRVLTNYNGVFVGNYTIDSCADTGGFADQAFCAGFPMATPLPIAFNNSQSSDLTTMASLFALGQVQGTGTGAIASNGALTYAGSIVSGTTRLDFRNFAAASASINHYNGTFQIVWTDSVLSGTSTWTCTMQDVTRTSGGAATLSVPSTPIAMSRAALAAAVRSPRR